MITLIKSLLSQLLNDIDTKNSNISESEQQKILDFLQTIYRDDLSKTESSNYLGVSRATFDNYIKKGIIPKGKKRQGVSSKFWSKYELNKCKKVIQKSEHLTQT